MDPYKVLGVTPQTSDDDVKRAYRDLARKYHPDNYVGNPLADLAEARMKEINEAYDAIMEARKPPEAAQQQQQSYQQPGYQQQSYQQPGYQQQGYGYGAQQRASYSGPNAAIYSQVRQAINQGNIGLAESLLQRITQQDAEWYYLQGVIFYRKGWYDEASRSFEKACQMDPENREYQAALANLNLSEEYGGYRPMTQVTPCDCCFQLMCLQCCCQPCCGSWCW